MRKAQFIKNYVASFLGAFAANEYQEQCRQGWKHRDAIFPVEDAQTLAEAAWERGCQLLGWIDA